MLWQQTRRSKSGTISLIKSRATSNSLCRKKEKRLLTLRTSKTGTRRVIWESKTIERWSWTSLGRWLRLVLMQLPRHLQHKLLTTPLLQSKRILPELLQILQDNHNCPWMKPTWVKHQVSRHLPNSTSLNSIVYQSRSQLRIHITNRTTSHCLYSTLRLLMLSENLLQKKQRYSLLNWKMWVLWASWEHLLLNKKF